MTGKLCCPVTAVGRPTSAPALCLTCRSRNNAARPQRLHCPTRATTHSLLYLVLQVVVMLSEADQSVDIDANTSDLYVKPGPALDQLDRDMEYRLKQWDFCDLSEEEQSLRVHRRTAKRQAEVVRQRNVTRIRDRLSKGEFDKTSMEWADQYLPTSQFTKLEIALALVWCHMRLKRLLRTYESTCHESVSLPKFLDNSNRDDSPANVIQWHEVHPTNLLRAERAKCASMFENDLRLRRSTAAWGKAIQNIETQLRQYWERRSNLEGGTTGQPNEDRCKEEYHSSYNRLLKWAKHAVRLSVVSQSYLSTPGGSHCQPAFLFKPAFNELILKDIVKRLIEDGVMRLQQFIDMRRQIELQHPRYTHMLPLSADIEPPRRKNMDDLWIKTRTEIDKADLSAGGPKFRRSIAVLARDVQVIYWELEKARSLLDQLAHDREHPRCTTICWPPDCRLYGETDTCSAHSFSPSFGAARGAGLSE